MKVSYVYGERYVEKAIEDVCTKLVAMDLILSDDRSVLLPEGTQNVDLGSKYQLFKAQVAETLLILVLRWPTSRPSFVSTVALLMLPERHKKAALPLMLWRP